MEPAVIPVWKLRTVYAGMFAVTAILSCVIKIRGLFKSTKWRHFENVKFEALSARRDFSKTRGKLFPRRFRPLICAANPHSFRHRQKGAEV